MYVVLLVTAGAVTVQEKAPVLLTVAVQLGPPLVGLMVTLLTPAASVAVPLRVTDVPLVTGFGEAEKVTLGAVVSVAVCEHDASARMPVMAINAIFLFILPPIETVDRPSNVPFMYLCAQGSWIQSPSFLSISSVHPQVDDEN